MSQYSHTQVQAMSLINDSASYSRVSLWAHLASVLTTAQEVQADKSTSDVFIKSTVSYIPPCAINDTNADSGIHFLMPHVQVMKIE